MIELCVSLPWWWCFKFKKRNFGANRCGSATWETAGAVSKQPVQLQWSHKRQVLVDSIDQRHWCPRQGGFHFEVEQTVQNQDRKGPASSLSRRPRYKWDIQLVEHEEVNSLTNSDWSSLESWTSLVDDKLPWKVRPEQSTWSLFPGEQIHVSSS